MTVKMTITGEGTLRKALEQLPQNVQKRVARKALRPGASLINKELKKAVPAIDDEEAESLLGQAVPKGTGKDLQRHIKKGIRRRKKTYKNTGIVLEAIGPAFDFRAVELPNRPTAGYLAQQIEKGDDQNPAQPFLRPAADRVATRALSLTLDKALEVVEEEAKKLAAKQAARTGRGR